MVYCRYLGETIYTSEHIRSLKTVCRAIVISTEIIINVYCGVENSNINTGGAVCKYSFEFGV